MGAFSAWLFSGPVYSSPLHPQSVVKAVSALPSAHRSALDLDDPVSHSLASESAWFQTGLALFAPFLLFTA